MTKMEFQIVEMLGRVVAFGEANVGKFPKKSLLWVAMDAIKATIAKTYEMSALQDPRIIRLCTEARQAARDAVNRTLDAIHQTSLAVAIDVPQADMFFRVPGYPRRDGDIMQAGEQFAKHAESLKAAFVEHHMPTDFIDTLKVGVEDFRQAIDKQRLAKNDKTRAAAQINASITDALMNLQRVESIVKNTLQDDPAALAAWETARRVAKVRKVKKAGKTQPAAKPEPAEQEAAIAASS